MNNAIGALQQAQDKIAEARSAVEVAKAKARQQLQAARSTAKSAKAFAQQMKIQRYEDDLLAMSRAPINFMTFDEIINPNTGEYYTQAEAEEAIENAMRRERKIAGDQLVKIATDPYGLGSYSEVINPETGDPFTFLEGQALVDEILGQNSGASASDFPEGTIHLDFEVPERLVNSGSEDIQIQVSALSSPIEITGGFMEDHDSHSYKSAGAFFISGDSPDIIQHKPPGRFNLGIDYVIPGSLSDSTNLPVTETWFNGTVKEIIPSNTGYGNRVIIETDQFYTLNGIDHPIFTGYAHLDSFQPDMKVEQQIEAGTSIGIMGNTGGSHGDHVDLQIWINVNGDIINISPNALNSAMKLPA